MSEIRLIMVEKNCASSGHIPSSSIPALIWAIAKGAKNENKLWNLLEKMDPGLKEHFYSNLDKSPILEGFDDGLLVISWDHKCIESFQVYQPLKPEGSVFHHNGTYQETDHEGIEYQLEKDWKIIDHHFEESRH